MTLQVELVTMGVTILVQALNTLALVCQGSMRSSCCCGELVHEEAGDKLDYGSDAEVERKRVVSRMSSTAVTDLSMEL